MELIQLVQEQMWRPVALGYDGHVERLRDDSVHAITMDKNIRQVQWIYMEIMMWRGSLRCHQLLVSACGGGVERAAIGYDRSFNENMDGTAYK